MKTKRAVAIIFAVCMAVALCGCTKSNLEKYSENISELREHIFAAESAEYKVTAISGMREEPYEMNGVSAGSRDFTVVTVTPADFKADKSYRYRTEIAGEVYEGDLLPHPFAQSLSADIPAEAKEDFTFTVTGDGEVDFQMVRAVTGEMISADKALGIALDKLSGELKKFRSGGTLNAEIYVRLMENPIDGNGGYFWYVAFVGEDKATVAVLLRGDTGAVSAIRT